MALGLTAASFCDLPRELQLHIFSFILPSELLTTVRLVCKDWWRLSKDASLWKYLHCYVRKEEQTMKFDEMLRCRPMLAKLHITTHFSLEVFAVSSHVCPMLKHLDVRYCQHVDDRILALFVQNCPLIEELNLTFCHKVDRKCVVSIVGLRFLRDLYLSYCFLIDDDCVQLILQKCRRLEYLDLSGAERITDKSFCNSGSNLNTTLEGLCLPDDTLTDLAFSGISLFTKLELLSIWDDERLTDQTLVYLKMLTGLKSLSVTNATLWTTVAVNDFFAGSHISNLVELEFNGIRISNDGVYNLTQNCKLLQFLSLHRCYGVTERGLERIVQHCDNLMELKLTSMDYLTGRCLNAVPVKLSHLQSLDVSLSYGINRSVLRDLAYRVPRLRIEFPSDSESDTDND